MAARETLGDPRAQKARTEIASPYLLGGRPPVPAVESAAPFRSQHDLPALRGWQKAAYAEYFAAAKRDFLLVATPGAGKTTYALTIAKELLTRHEVQAVTIVTPTEHLKYQWAQAAKRFNIAIDPSYRNAQGRAGADFHGVAVTYAQVAAHPALHRGRTENRTTLVIFDEIHHAGDALSWGDAVKEAFDPAKRRLALTGTQLAAGEAVAIGLIHQAVPLDALDAALDKTLAELGRNGPNALMEIKRFFDAIGEYPPSDERAAFTAQTISRVRATPEAKEGFAAFFAKRPPAWEPGAN